MTKPRDKLLQDIGSFNKNPSSINQVTLNYLADINEGIDIADSNNPLIQMIDVSATHTAGFINETKVLERKNVAKTVIEKKDLYRHMSDMDFIDMFSSPPIADNIIFAIPTEDLKDVGFPVDGGTIFEVPRDTAITVNGDTFTLHKAIRINALSNNTYTVQWIDRVDDIVLDSNISNVISHTVTEIDGREYLLISPSVRMMAKTTNIFTVDNAVSLLEQVMLEDRFYTAKAWVESNSGVWAEMDISYNPNIYDINRPTLILTIENSILTVKLPDVYQSIGLPGDNIRLDILTCPGRINTVDLSQLPSSDFSFQSFNYDYLNEYPAEVEWGLLRNIVLTSDGKVSGGSNGKTIDEIRDLVIYRKDSARPPVNLDELRSKVVDRGYGFSLVDDSIFNQVYLVSRGLPTKLNNGVSIPARTVTPNITIDSNDLDRFEYCLSSNTAVGRATLKSNALFKSDAGNARILSTNEYDALFSRSTEQIVAAINSEDYYYTPFHYVMDTSEGVLSVRPYWLSGPRVVARNYIGRSDTSTVNILSVTPQFTEEGYVLEVLVSAPDGLALSDNMYIQFYYHNPAYGSRSYSLVEPVDVSADSALFHVKLLSDFDIDETDNFSVNSLKNISGLDTRIYMGLSSEVELIVAVESTTSQNTFNGALNSNLSTNSLSGLTRDSFNLEFGNILNGLFVANRQLIGKPTYAVYDSDIPRVYPRDVFEAIEVNGDIEFQKVHSQGELWLDENGDEVIVHHAGDNKIIDGKYVVDVPANVVTRIGVFMVDAAYLLANDPVTVEYRESIPEIVDSYLKNDIIPMSLDMGERNSLNLVLHDSPSRLAVDTGKGIRYINSNVSFQVTIYVSEVDFNNTGLIERVKLSTEQIISKSLDSTLVSVNNITKEITNANSEVILSANVEGFDSSGSLDTIKLISPYQRLVVRELLRLRDDGSINLQHDINVTVLPLSK